MSGEIYKILHSYSCLELHRQQLPLSPHVAHHRISASKQSSFAPIDGGECTLHPVRADDNLNAFRIYPDEKVEIV